MNRNITFVYVILQICLLTSPNTTFAYDEAKKLTVEKIRSVYDGDTFRAFILGESEDRRIRIRSVDTPEIKGKCEFEKDKAIQARNFTRAKLLKAKQVTLINIGKDRYNRMLADVLLDGKDLSKLLIEADLARPWRGRRESWCYKI